MRLYHGTSRRVAEKILKEGIKPRGAKRGNWQHTVTSNPNAIYLTDCYAWHFANAASKDTEHLALIEIESDRLDEFFFLPDEDFLEQVTREATHEQLMQSDAKMARAIQHKDMKQRTLWFRKYAWRWKPLWRKSLEGLGTCCYTLEIPPEAITRVSYFDPMSNKDAWMAFRDCTVSVMAHKILRQKYLTFTRWLFGEKVTVADWLGMDAESTKAWFEMAKSHDIEKSLNEIIAKQDGVVVVDVNP